MKTGRAKYCQQQAAKEYPQQELSRSIYLDKSHQEALAKRKIDGTHLQARFLSRVDVCRQVADMDRPKDTAKPAEFAQSECSHSRSSQLGQDEGAVGHDSVQAGLLATSSVLSRGHCPPVRKGRWLSSQHPEAWEPCILEDWGKEHQVVPRAFSHRAVHPAQKMSDLRQVVLKPSADAKNASCFGVSWLPPFVISKKNYP
jgi:hypothetical protein